MDDRLLAVLLAALSVIVAASALIALGNGGVVYVHDMAPLVVNDKGVDSA